MKNGFQEMIFDQNGADVLLLHNVTHEDGAKAELVLESLEQATEEFNGQEASITLDRDGVQMLRDFLTRWLKATS